MKSIVPCLLVTFSICMLSISLHAQQFELKNGDEVKTLDFNEDWYVVQRIGQEDECCNTRRYLGNIVKISEDSIQLSVKTFESMRADDEKSYYSEVKFNTKQEFPMYNLAKSDLKNIQQKQGAWKDVLGITGVALFFTSVGTAIHAFVVDDRKALLISSAIQLGTSIALIGVGSAQKEKYKLQSDAWQFQ